MPTPQDPPAKNFVEKGSIYPIPETARFGTSRDLFTIWFGGNLMILTISTGALTTGVFHLSLPVALLTLVLGNLIGGLFMALHAAQGPILGVPQMVQARGQFGTVGAAIITLLLIFMYVGFTASNIILGGETFNFIVPTLNRSTSLLIVAFFCLLPALGGYYCLHLAGKLSTFLGITALTTCIILLVKDPEIYKIIVNGSPHSTNSLSNVVGAFSIIALWQIAFAPYVSDYSRYLPATKQGVKNAFWATYGGSCLGAFFPMTIGMLLGFEANSAGALVGSLYAHLSSSSTLAATLVLCSLILGMAGPTAMNIYCGALAALSIFQTFFSSYNFGRRSRLLTTLALFILACWCVFFMTNDFLHRYIDFLDILMMIMIPWTAINLVDYYLIHHAKYDVNAFFKKDGGIYGRINKTAFLCFFLSLILQFPFLVTPAYVGPIACHLHSVDISWLIGLGTTSTLYYIVSKKIR
ncbi:purine-cytosine permease family protein [Acetobacter senegalensis]|uniref:purine-cytosine permease family protein n=1 Tax=Acetobacter senegalensis TaxID=446692 RepID=UPI002652FFC8|nr:cytosine permease [Acetobacter senegalensis]MDN7355437.1 cytosine permease [Acetobacter senegalensis]